MANTRTSIKSLIFEGFTKFNIKCDDTSCKVIGDSLFNATQYNNSITFKSKPTTFTSSNSERSWLEYFFSDNSSTFIMNGNNINNTEKNSIVISGGSVIINSDITINGKNINYNNDTVTINGKTYVAQNSTDSSDGDEGYYKEYEFANPIKLTDIYVNGATELTFSEENNNNIADDLNCVTSGSAKLFCNFSNLNLNSLVLLSSGASGLNFKTNAINDLFVESSGSSCAKISCTQSIPKAKLMSSGSSEIISNTSIIDANIQSSGSSKINSFLVKQTGNLSSSGASSIYGKHSNDSVVTLKTSGMGQINIQKQK